METLVDKDLGQIIIKRNARAKSVIARRKEDHIQLTAPTFCSMKHIKDALEQMKPRLLALKAKTKVLFTPETPFKSLSFELKLSEGKLNNYYINLSENILSIHVPIHCKFEDAAVQSTIRELIERALRREAKRILPDKVQSFATTYGFEFVEVKINKSRTRWGSCSQKKSINLSYFCMLLPSHLIDFIILHELCHTREMNHSDRFWAELDKVTNNKSKELTRELKETILSW